MSIGVYKMADSSEWVSFDEDNNNDKVQPPLIDKPTEIPEFLSSEAYISVLENKLKKVKGEDPAKLTSKDLLESVRQARESQLERMVNNDRDTNNTTAFIVDDKETVSCMNVYTRMFPKQPINSQELECLVDEEEERKILNEEQNS